MSLPLLILRPLEGARQTQKRAADRGLRAVVDPLFTIAPMAWSAPPASEFDALLLTSANALELGGRSLDSYRNLPVLAVGQKTATAASEAGFRVAATGAGGAQQLLGQLAAEAYPTLLWLAGQDHSDLAPLAHKITIVPVYQSRPVTLGDKARACLSGEAVILLHSARAARHLAAECDRLQLPKGRHHVLGFSEKVAEAAGAGWKSVQAASDPDDDALLFLASALCRSR